MPVLSIERVVVVLTPLFAAAATWLVTLVATNVPGVPRLDASAVEGVEIAAFLGAVGIVAKWLHGRQIPAVAQLKPSAFELAAIEDVVSTWLDGNVDRLHAPPGITPEGVRRVAHDEVARILSSAAQSPTKQQ